MWDEMTLVKSSLDDWYTIEFKEHDGREWWERTGTNSSSLRMSCRPSDACIEGSADEMKEIAAAIRDKRSVSFKRCEAELAGDEYWLSSPRNSRRHYAASMQTAKHLADEIERILIDEKGPPQ